MYSLYVCVNIKKLQLSWQSPPIYVCMLCAHKLWNVGFCLPIPPPPCHQPPYLQLSLTPYLHNTLWFDGAIVFPLCAQYSHWPLVSRTMSYYPINTVFNATLIPWLWMAAPHFKTLHEHNPSKSSRLLAQRCVLPESPRQQNPYGSFWAAFGASSENRRIFHTIVQKYVK